MKIKKALAFVLAMALCVAMPTTVFAKDEPAEVTDATFEAHMNSSLNETESTPISMENVSVARQDTPMASVAGGISVTVDTSVPDEDVDRLVSNALSSLTEIDKTAAKQVSIHIKTRELNNAEFEQLLNEFSGSQPVAAADVPCTDPNGHAGKLEQSVIHTLFGPTRCEYSERFDVTCRNCGWVLSRQEFPKGSHIPGEMPGCPFRPGMKNLLP